MASDGNVYTKKQFIDHFGGLTEWEQATPNASVDDHHWFKEKLQEEEELALVTEAKLQVLLVTAWKDQ